MRFEELAIASREIGDTRSRLKKIERLSVLFTALAPIEIEPAVALLSGEPRQGRIGVGGALLSRLFSQPTSSTASVSVEEVDAALQRFSELNGPGSARERELVLGALFSRLTELERAFLAGVLGGGLRQGALEGVVLEAVAKAARVPMEALRRALLFAGNVHVVAREALTNGGAGLGGFALTLFQPLRPMLADTAPTLAEALEQEPRAALEYKLDGARIQLHKRGQDIAVFSRHGQDVTARVPEIVASAREFPANELLLDGEAIAFAANGRPLPFQTTMQRFGRQKNVETARESIPLSQVYFDCLYKDGKLLVDRPNEERFAALRDSIAAPLVVPRQVVDDAKLAERFVSSALEAGHEGVLVKSLRASYDAGRRGSTWLKLKPVHTLDLVVLAAEWGSGRRKGYLSNIHLGARDPVGGGFVMLGKTFKGMTDAMLQWQTKRFQELVEEPGEYVVKLRPEVVVEIAFDGVQESSQYEGGLSLRFARVKSYREDKRPEEADTIARVREIFERSRGVVTA
ncbi:MAG TPA: ATP-dependent DNA ligase [Polyangiaceae bacterium]|nr:ATP-dependent DNA ligase [Polyangiaceae bacterium]